MRDVVGERTVTSLGGARAPEPPEANSAKGTIRAGNSTIKLSGITTSKPEIETEPPRFRAVPAFAAALRVLSEKNIDRWVGKAPIEKASYCEW